MYRNHRFSSSWILDGMMKDQHFRRRPEARGKIGLPEWSLRRWNARLNFELVIEVVWKRSLIFHFRELVLAIEHIQHIFEQYELSFLLWHDRVKKSALFDKQQNACLYISRVHQL